MVASQRALWSACLLEIISCAELEHNVNNRPCSQVLGSALYKNNITSVSVSPPPGMNSNQIGPPATATLLLRCCARWHLCSWPHEDRQKVCQGLLDPLLPPPVAAYPLSGLCGLLQAYTKQAWVSSGATCNCKRTNREHEQQSLQILQTGSTHAQMSSRLEELELMCK